MKKYIKKFETFTKELKGMKIINEGGGAGISFKTDNVTMNIEMVISKDKLDITKYDVEIETFDAEGYDDGLLDVISEGMFNIEKPEISIDEIKNLVFNEDDIVELKDTFDIDENDNIVNLGDMFNSVPELVLEMSIELNGKYDDMLFAGYIRGTIEEGTTIMCDFDLDYISYLIKDQNNPHIYMGIEYFESDFNKFPCLMATEEFVVFYNDVFKNYYKNVKSEGTSGEYIVFNIEENIIVDITHDEEITLEEGQELISRSDVDKELLDSFIDDYQPTEGDYQIYNDYINHSYK